MSPRIRGLIWAALALAVGGLAYLLGVGSTLGQRAEESVLDASAFTVDPPAPLSLVSPQSVIGVLVLLGLLALWVHGISRTLTVLVSGGVAIVTSQLLKEAWLERPDLLEFDAQNTFPSGHMTVFTAVIAVLVWAVSERWRMIMSVFGAALLAVVAWQLLEYGWHRPSDLLGAQALVVLAFSIAAWIGPRRTRSRSPGSIPSALNRVLSIVLLVVGALVTLCGVLLMAVAAGVRSDALMLNAGEIALMGTSVLTVRILAKLCP